MDKPRLTARIVRGLGAIYALADVNRFEDPDLYAGCKDAHERKEVDDATVWLGNLIDWYRHKKGGR